MAEKISVGKFINNMDKEDLTSTDLQGVVSNVYAKAIADHKKTTKIADDNLKDKDKETVEFTKSNHDRLKAHKNKPEKDIDKDDATAKDKVAKEINENKSVRRSKRKVNESLEDIKSEWENMKRANMFEFPSGDYVYVGIDFDKKTIYAGGATNTGIFRDTEIDLDEDDSLDGNLVRLYDAISEEHPEYFEIEESKSKSVLESKQVNEAAENEFEVVKYKGNQYGIWAKTSKNWMMFGKKADLEKRVKELNAGHKDYKKIDEDLLEPGNIYSVLVKELPAEDIDHHDSDLYVRKTPKSTEIINRLTTKSLLSTFKDNIDGDIWYELPFCFSPHFQKEGLRKSGKKLNEEKEEYSFEEIIDMMASAEEYEDLYYAASLIKNDDLRIDVEELIDSCERDEDDVDTAYSIVTSDLLDNKVNELNVKFLSSDHLNLDDLRAQGGVERVGEEAWKAACSGDTEWIETIFNDGHLKPNEFRYNKFGAKHSLIMGALRNQQFETAEVLKSLGEKILRSEVDEYKSIMAKKTYTDETSEGALDESKRLEERRRSKKELADENLDFEYTVRDAQGDVINGFSTKREAVKCAKNDSNAQWVEYEEFDKETGEPFFSEVVWGEIGESKGEKLTETPIPRNATKIKVGGKEFTKEKDWVDGNRVHVSPKDIKRLYGNDVEVLETDPNYKSKRTKEVKVLQGNYGYGWDDLVEYDKEDSAELKQDLKSYRENERNAQFRVVTRRVPLGEDKLTETVKSNLFQPSVDPWERHLIDTSAWIKGTIVKDGAEYQVSAKVFNEPSQYGINHGRISKLWVKEKGWPVAINYDRGWVDAPPHNDDLLNTVMKELEAYRDKHPISVKESMNKSRKVTESKTPYGGTTIEDYVNVNFNGSQENKDKLIAKVKKKAIGGDYFNGLNMSVKDWKKAGEEFGLTMKSYPVTESKETCASWKVTYGKGRPGGSEEIIKAKDYEEAKQLAAKHANGWGFEVKRVNESKKLTEAPTIDSYEKGDFKAYYGTSKDEDEDPNKPYYSNMNLFDKNGEVIGSFGYSRFEDEESAKKDFEKKKKAIDRSLGKTQATGKKLREDWTVFEFTSGSNPYIAKTDKEVKRLLRKYKGKVRKINDTHYEVDDKKNFDWDKPMVDNDSLPFGPGAPLEEAKGKKVYVVIEISRDSDVPKLIGVYSNKSDAEKDAYSEGRRWCNVIETTLKGSLKDESLKEARYNDGVAKGQHIASVDLFSTGVSDEDKKKAKELGHYEIDLDNKVFTRVKGNHWLGHWRIESYPRDTWEEVEKTARNIMKDGNFKEVSNDKYIEIQKDWENKRH